MSPSKQFTGFEEKTLVKPGRALSCIEESFLVHKWKEYREMRLLISCSGINFSL